MPRVSNTNYQVPPFLKNPHLNTLYAAIFRKVTDLHYQRQRVETPDGDFLDLDWSSIGADRLILVLHGLEGSANRPYVRGMIKYFNQHGWDGVGMNFRGCSGVLNRKIPTYHMGSTGDLAFVVEQIQALDRYREVVIAGFSLGGNVVLRYLGEQGQHLPKIVGKGVAFSVPCDIKSSNEEINKWYNALYLDRFLKSMNKKMEAKAASFPAFNASPFGRRARSFNEFDEWFTAPMNGFKNAVDYWTKAASLPVLSQINVPTLLINAKDDTFLAENCYPYELAAENRHLYFECPPHGGHVGFVEFKTKGAYYTDRRALEFISRS
ncbi:MAG: alpha/beta fold hydrolase [Saprospiraceae bacterium]|nr:alpha/beta fold hydrolase [Saprospiraceae bacterium]